MEKKDGFDLKDILNDILSEEKVVIVFYKDYQNAEFEEYSFKTCKPYLKENKDEVIRAIDEVPSFQDCGKDILDELKMLSVSCISIAVASKAEITLEYDVEKRALFITMEADEYVLSGELMISVMMIASHAHGIGVFPLDSGKSKMSICYCLDRKDENFISTLENRFFKTTDM